MKTTSYLTLLLLGLFWCSTTPAQTPTQGPSTFADMYKSHPGYITISGGVAVGMISKKETPSYPLQAKENGVQGTVVLMAVVDEKGKVEDLAVVQGPELLRDAALESVKHWKYHPYIRNGQPVGFITQINVVFSLGG